jgi:hypothetical protein
VIDVPVRDAFGQAGEGGTHARLVRNKQYCGLSVGGIDRMKNKKLLACFWHCVWQNLCCLQHKFRPQRMSRGSAAAGAWWNTIRHDMLQCCST